MKASKKNKVQKTTAAPVFKCQFCDYTSPKEKGVRMHTMKKHGNQTMKDAASKKETADIKSAIANAEKNMVYPETAPTPPPAALSPQPSQPEPISPPVASSPQPSQPEPAPPISPAEKESEEIRNSILAAEEGMVLPEPIPDTEPAIADVINRQATEQDALINIARYIREKGTTSMKKEVLLSLGVPESSIPETGSIMFKNRHLIRRVTQGHDLLSVEQP